MFVLRIMPFLGLHQCHCTESRDDLAFFDIRASLNSTSNLVPFPLYYN